MIRVNAYPCKTASLTIPWSGCWELVAQWEGKNYAGEVVVDWRGWKLKGHVDPSRQGLFTSEPSAVIVGGLPWCTRRTWRPFQSDRGITAREVALSIASQLGQTIEVAQDRPLGKLFVPRNESGGQLLTRLFGKAWHVGTDGIARAQTRAVATVGKSVAVLEYDPRDGQAKVYADRPDQVPIGAILPKDSRLATSRRVVQINVNATGTKERIVCYTEAA